MQRTRVYAVLLVLLATVAIVALVVDASPSSSETSSPPRTRTIRPRVVPPLPSYPIEAGEIQVGLIVRYVAAVDRETVGRYIAGLIETERVEAQRRADEEAAARRVPVPSAPSAPVSGGDCSGFPLPASIIQRESGGDPNAVNPSSGTFGCAQLQPFHFADGGACAGMATDKDGQIACTYELQRRAGMSPWSL